MPKPYGTLTVAKSTFGGERLLPWYAAPTEVALMEPVYEFLLNRKPGVRDLIPGLAKDWTMSPDGLSWTFHLRQGVQFHDGWGELTSADVKFSFEQQTKPEARGYLSSALRTRLQGIDVPDQYTVVIRLKQPDVVFAYEVSQDIPSVPILSKKYVETVGEKEAEAHPIGSGPFKLAEHKAGDYLKFEALDTHWRQVAGFKTLILRNVPQDATRVAMLRSGDADVVEVPMKLVPMVQSAGLKLLRIPTAKHSVVAFGGWVLPTRDAYDPTVPWVPGNDPARALKVRKAMALAIDKEAIAKNILGGTSTIAIQWFLPGQPSYDPSWKPIPYDPEQARQLLKDAGYPNGFKVIVNSAVIPGFDNILDFAEAVAMDWEKIGLQVTRQYEDYGSLRATWAARKSAWKVFPNGWSINDEPFQTPSAVMTTNSAVPWGHESYEMDAWIAKMAGELDPKKRAEIERQFGQWCLDNVLVIPVANVDAFLGVNKKVGQWPLTLSASYYHNYEYITHGD